MINSHSKYVEPLQVMGYMANAQETEFIQLLNAARLNPMEYMKSIGVVADTKYVPLGSLLANMLLVQASRLHSIDMMKYNYFGHRDRNGDDPGKRISLLGFRWRSWAESIAAGHKSATETLKQLIIDQGVYGHGHRKMLLETPATYKIGVGYSEGGTYGAYWTIDLALPL